MPNHAKNERLTNVSILVKTGLTLLACQLLFLASSEFFNCSFNYLFDMQKFDLAERIAHVFKPLVIGIFLASILIQVAIVHFVLKPVWTAFRTGTVTQKARNAPTVVPWVITLTQAATWIGGTTVYYLLRNWNAESGIPYEYGLLLKSGAGFEGTIISCVLVNLLLIPLRQKLDLSTMQKGDHDLFIKYKDLIAVVGTAFYFASHFIYLTHYLSLKSFEAFPQTAILAWILFFAAVSIAVSVVSRFENNRQSAILIRQMGNLANAETNAVNSRVQLVYFDELGRLSSLINEFLANFKTLLDSLLSSSTRINAASDTLSTSAREVSLTTNMQAAAVKEVVSTMEDSNSITQSVGQSIMEVARISSKTKECVNSGKEIMKQTTEKMSEIKTKNADYIAGIRSLTKKIQDIWGIVDIINSIVEQTRIIAFNAALEASTAGETGKNFQIVATEIKRLADSTSESTQEILARISEIQKAANNLIIVSEEGTQKIRQGHDLTLELDGVFKDIQISADISASSSEQIELSIKQQISAFDQILITMREISSGIDNLAGIQSHTEETTHSLKALSDELHALASRYIAVDAAGGAK